MAGWVSSYHHNGYTYNRGDALVINGSYYYDITDTTPNGTLSNETKYFYGVFVYDDGSLPRNPVGLMNYDYNNSPTRGTCQFSDIASGGTPDTFTYSFNANGGSGAPSAMTKTYGEHFTFPTTIPTRKGYIFKGWNNGSVNNGKTYAAGEQVVGLPDEDIIWWADWDPITYYIKYNGNGSTSGSMSNSTCEYDSAETLKANAYLKTGHSFNAWNTKSNGSGTSYADKASVKNLTSTDGATVNLYAQWAVNEYDLVVNPNGGTWEGSAEKQTFPQDYGTKKTISNPTRVGYTFSGWSLSGYGTFSNGVYTYGAGTGTLTATWTRIELKVTFDASTNGGSPNSEKNVYYGDTVGTLPEAKKQFYKFIGWFTKASGGTQISASQIITTNVTYYAQYKIDASVKVKYDGNKMPSIVWRRLNGIWKKCVTWVKKNGTWYKSTGADE